MTIITPLPVTYPNVLCIWYLNKHNSSTPLSGLCQHAREHRRLYQFHAVLVTSQWLTNQSTLSRISKFDFQLSRPNWLKILNITENISRCPSLLTISVRLREDYLYCFSCLFCRRSSQIHCWCRWFRTSSFKALAWKHPEREKHATSMICSIKHYFFH